MADGEGGLAFGGRVDRETAAKLVRDATPEAAPAVAARLVPQGFLTPELWALLVETAQAGGRGAELIEAVNAALPSEAATRVLLEALDGRGPLGWYSLAIELSRRGVLVHRHLFTVMAALVEAGLVVALGGARWAIGDAGRAWLGASGEGEA